jgi:hypothetical protein
VALPEAPTLALGALATLPIALLYLVSVYHAGATLLSRRRLLATTVTRATAYGFAPMVLAVVPGVGLAVGLLLSGLLHYHALRRHLGLSWWQATAVLSMPILPLLAASGVDRLFV